MVRGFKIVNYGEDVYPSGVRRGGFGSHSFHPRRFWLWAITLGECVMVQCRLVDGRKTRQWIKQVHTFLRPGLFLVAYHTSATLFPFHPDLLPMLGSLFALIAILFLSLDRTMEARSREIEIAHRQTQVLVALAKEGEPFGSAGKRGRTRAAAAKIEEVKETLEAKIIKAEIRLRSEWRFVVVLIAIVLLEFQALLSSLKH